MRARTIERLGCLGCKFERGCELRAKLGQFIVSLLDVLRDFDDTCLSRSDQFAESCGDDVDATAESAHRKFAGCYEAVGGFPADSQELRGRGTVNSSGSSSKMLFSNSIHLLQGWM